jgi:FMN phosphatase YigB (HAD superfamily)
MEVEAFIFDIGNVLALFDDRRMAPALSAHGAGGPTIRAIRALAVPYERGEVTRGRFLEGVAALLAPGATAGELASVWQEIFTPNHAMWKLVENLHGRYPLYLLSNTNCLHLEYLRREYPALAKFRDGVFSHEVRLLKPDPGIFQLAIRRFGVRPANTVYLDDLAANVDAARGAGLRALQYDPGAHEACLGELRAMGVQCV